MNASHAGSSTARVERGLLVDLIASQIDRLIPLFDVAPQRSIIQRAYRTLCSASLAIDPGACVPEWSRINADGTPFQFALHLNGSDPPALQFLGEAGRLRCGPEERTASGFACLDRLGDILDLGDQVMRVRPWLESWTSHRESEPGADLAGALWFALAFVPGAPPTLTVYLNNAWGRTPERWRRLDALSARLGASVAIDGEREDEHHVVTPTRATPMPATPTPATPMLAPLGASVVLRGDGRVSGRAYFSGFGVAVDHYRRLLSQATPFDAFVHHLIGDDACYPTRSSIYSYELSAAPSSGAQAIKIELCAHCAFDDDRQAAARISAWLGAARLRPEVYHSALDALLGDRTLSTTTRPAVHSVVGVGVRRGEPYASIYINPGPILRS